MLKAVLDLIQSHFFCPLDPELFDLLTNSLLEHDNFMVCADFDAYCAMQDKVSDAFQDQETWLKKSIVNVAKSGEFSSDNSIAQYAQEIWQIPYKIAANQKKDKVK